MKSHLKTKPKQDIKSFLSNFENYLKQQKDKFWKQARIDLVEENYDQFAIFVVLEIYKDKMFRCQFFEYVMKQQLNTIEQIRDSMIVREDSKSDRGSHKDVLFTNNDHVDFTVKMLEKVAQRLSIQSRPNKLATLQNEIKNHISNQKDNCRTTEIEKAIIETDTELSSRIISVLKDLNIVSIDRTTAAQSVQYSESPIQNFRDAKMDEEGLNHIIKARFM